MQRLRNNDRGATAPFVALLIIPLIAFAAIAIDVAAMHTDRQQLQTGADAAAFAIAQDCARDSDTCDESAAVATADEMAKDNKNDRDAEAYSVELDTTLGEVGIATTTQRQHWFAPLIGVESTDLYAQAGARWGYPSAGTAVWPMAFGVCELFEQTGVEAITDDDDNIIGLDIPGETEEFRILNTKGSKTECTGPSDNLLPGGFGWITADSEPSMCRARTVAGERATSDSGADFPCKDTKDEFFEGLLGQTLLLPIFDEVGDDWYAIIGYAAFTLTHYEIGANGPDNAGSGGLCDGYGKGNTHCLAGKFTQFADTGSDFDLDPNGPNFGAAIVALTD